MTLPERPCLDGPGRLADPFDGLFDQSVVPAQPGDLLDVPAAARWLEVVGWGMASDLYTYQQPLAGRAGPRVRSGERSYLQLSAYDYLGLVGHPAIEAAAIAAIRHAGTSTGGVRLLSGTHELHQTLERDLARFLGTEAAVTFGSGYSANLGTIPALFGPRDLVIADARIHRSIADGCRLAGVPVRLFRHNDMAALRRELDSASRPARTLIAVEGVYSMDGDRCPLDEIVALKQRAGAYLLLDEAHSLGVLGMTGRGAVEAFGVQPAHVDLRTGSLAKAIPASGGFVAGARDLITYLQHGSAPFMFSAALAPAAAAAARAALLVLLREPGRLERMHRNAARLRNGLQALGFDTGTSASPLVPVITGSERAAWRLARQLFARGIFVTAVVHPAVARGSARLRLCATAAHDDSDITEALTAFEELASVVQGGLSCCSRRHASGSGS